MKTNEKEPITRFDKALLELKETTKALIFSLLIIIKWVINLVYVIGFPFFELIIGLYYILRYLLWGKKKINHMPPEKKEKLIQLYEANDMEEITRKENWGLNLEVKWLINDMKESLKGE